MTSNNVTEAESVEPSEAAPAKSVDDRLIDELVTELRAVVHDGISDEE
ncbi:hypothetical protein OHA27_38530 [Streptomyces sp. NBC_01619]|nr:hypothetical protein [Streptomyces sp. NBC_01619]MCX4516000.1 hypothetical protein [Streptomyces sp. NBC_01619]